MSCRLEWAGCSGGLAKAPGEVGEARGSEGGLGGGWGQGLAPLSYWTTSLLSPSRMTDSGFREGLSKVNKTASGRELL